MIRTVLLAFTLALTIVATAQAKNSRTLVERVDIYAPSSSIYLGSELQWYAPDGRRLRLINTNASGEPTLLFFVLHDEQGRESEAIYFEDGSTLPAKETFEYRDQGRTRRTRYFGEDGASQGYVDVLLDSEGRDSAKLYFRDNGAQWAEEDIPRDQAGNMLGWHFRYLDREGGALFEYKYLAFDAHGRWTRRIRSRDGKPERFEARSLTDEGDDYPLQTPGVFGRGSVSTAASETSPSFSADGQTMVFARYDEDWARKLGFIARRRNEVWEVAPLPFGELYNIAIAPAAQTIYFAVARGELSELFRADLGADGWSEPVSLTRKFGIRGGYVAPQANGDLLFYDAGGDSGAGTYLATNTDEGYEPPRPYYVPESGPAFDAFLRTDGTLLVTRCFDQTCESGSQNGIWRIRRDAGDTDSAEKLAGMPYGWGAQTVPSLGLLVFTNGDDILMLPFAESDSLHIAKEQLRP